MKIARNRFFALMITSFMSASLFSYYNERLYDGNPAWKDCSRLEVVAKYLPENPVVFEVGAMDGTDSVNMARRWPEGKIISFEANPNQFKAYSSKAFNFSNMQGYNLAVNTYNGMTKFYVCWGTSGDDPIFEGASSLLEASEDMKIHYKGPEIIVPCVVFDDWCKDNNVSHIDFMWLDIEGFELQFLQSSPDILKTVKVIQSETNFYLFRKHITEFHVLKSFLEENGFKMIAHWYNEGLLGDAVFVRQELLD